MRQRNITAVIATLALGLSALNASAQDFPIKKPITLVVGFAAGGATDTAARVIAKTKMAPAATLRTSTPPMVQPMAA